MSGTNVLRGRYRYQCVSFDDQHVAVSRILYIIIIIEITTPLWQRRVMAKPKLQFCLKYLSSPGHKRLLHACNYDNASCDDDDVIVDLLAYCSRVGLALERARSATGGVNSRDAKISRRRPRYVKIVGVTRVSTAAVRARDIRRLRGTVGISSACRDITTIIF